LTRPELLEGGAPLRIRIEADPAARTLTIDDNGIGLSREEAIAHLGTIAKSGTAEFLKNLSGDQKKDANLIGQFGVGFYSAFMVADRVTLTTRRLGGETAWRWESTGDGSFTLGESEKAGRGTVIELHLKADEKEFLDEWRL